MSDAGIEKTGVASRAEVSTSHASRYLQQLCKHFAYKLEVTFDERSGQISFPMGSCRLGVRDAVLILSLAAPDGEQLLRLQDVVVRHLERFAFREALKIEWLSSKETG